MAGVERGDQRRGCLPRTPVTERPKHDGLVRVEWSGMPVSDELRDAIKTAVVASNAARRPSPLVRVSEQVR